LLVLHGQGSLWHFDVHGDKVSAARAVGRIPDHATNLAGVVMQLADGADLQHEPESNGIKQPPEGLDTDCIAARWPGCGD